MLINYEFISYTLCCVLCNITNSEFWRRRNSNQTTHFRSYICKCTTRTFYIFKYYGFSTVLLPIRKRQYISFYNIHNNPKYTIIIFRPASWFSYSYTLFILRHKNRKCFVWYIRTYVQIYRHIGWIRRVCSLYRILGVYTLTGC